MQTVIEQFESWLKGHQPNVNMRKTMDEGFPAYEHPLVMSLFSAYLSGWAHRANVQFPHLNKEQYETNIIGAKYNANNRQSEA